MGKSWKITWLGTGILDENQRLQRYASFRVHDIVKHFCMFEAIPGPILCRVEGSNIGESLISR